MASASRVLRVGASRALNRVPEPEIELAEELRRLPPPAAAVGRRAPLPHRLRASLAAGSRSDAPDLI
jgi:hypothetical protein